MIRASVILFCAAALFGCSPSEQTTDADVKAAMSKQVPDPAAAAVSSPMEGIKKGPGKK